MGLTAQGWTLSGGAVWTTDFEMVTPGNRGTGSYAMRCHCGGVGTKGASQTRIIPTSPGIYRLRATVAMSRLSGGDTARVKLNWYDAAGGGAGVNTVNLYFNSGNVTAINIWTTHQGYLYVPATAYAMDVHYVGYKVAAGTLDVDLDMVLVEKVPLHFSAYRDTTQSINNTTWTRVDLNGEEFDDGGSFDATTNHQWTAPYDGRYSFAGQVYFASLGSDGKTAIAAIIKNPGASQQLIAQQWHRLGSANDIIVNCASGPVDMVAGDVVQLLAYQDSGGALNVGTGVAGAHATFLRGFEVA